MSETTPTAGTANPLAEVYRFLEFQNIALNLPFALAFLFLAANGLPNAGTIVLIVLAFVGARNAGHAFNRYSDRDYDARNPRTSERVVPSGRWTPTRALAFAAGNAALLLVAAALLNRLALLLAPVALLIIFGYSYTKRFTWFTTPLLGLVEAITPAAVYVAVQDALPWKIAPAILGLFFWGTAFETIHSLGDVESDRALGLHSLPVRFGERRSVALLPFLHGAALVALGLFGVESMLPLPYFIGLLAIACLATAIDLEVVRRPTNSRLPFRLHFFGGLIFLLAVSVAIFVFG